MSADEGVGAGADADADAELLEEQLLSDAHMSWLPHMPMLTETIGNPLVAELPLRLSLTDHVRSALTFPLLVAGAPWLSRAPRGQGQPVMVVPGLTTGDPATIPLRRFLRRLGYTPYGWGLGLNMGPTRRVLGSLSGLVDDLAVEHGEPVALIGWSLGGNFARMVAREVPAAVSQVITMGSPIRMTHPKQVTSMNLYMRLARFHAPLDQQPPHDSKLPPLPVPSTALYSKCDGIVQWQATVGPVDATHENVETRSSHTAFGHDPAALWVIADRLAQPATNWQHFKPPWYARALYPTPYDPGVPAGRSSI
ncbi:MAG: alpha/beta hydrolase [Actinomycetes bacterium]